jgi:hypothetical protein
LTNNGVRHRSTSAGTSKLIGDPAVKAYGGGYDAGSLNVFESSHWYPAARGFVLLAPTAEHPEWWNPKYKIKGRAVANEDDVVCRTSAFPLPDDKYSECGTVAYADYEVTYPGDKRVRVVKVDSCNTRGGSSGGPWFKGNKAFGIHSGVIVGQCYQLYARIKDVLDATNTQLVVE